LQLIVTILEHKFNWGNYISNSSEKLTIPLRFPGAVTTVAPSKHQSDQIRRYNRLSENQMLSEGRMGILKHQPNSQVQPPLQDALRREDGRRQKTVDDAEEEHPGGDVGACAAEKEGGV
jgi:hypothetical protein